MNRYSIQIWHKSPATGEEELTTVPINSPSPLSADQLDQRRCAAVAEMTDTTVVYS